jgi:putative tricarboxylic transport membrane protein
MKLNDAVFGALFLVLAIAVLITAQSFPVIPGQKIGPGAFPMVLAAILGLCALLLIARGLRSGQQWMEAGVWMRSPRHVMRFVAVIGALLFYLIAASHLGFILTGVVLLIGLLRAFEVRWTTTLITAIASTLLIHTIFYKMLKVPLPWGLLEGVAW